MYVGQVVVPAVGEADHQQAAPVNPALEDRVGNLMKRCLKPGLLLAIASGVAGAALLVAKVTVAGGVVAGVGIPIGLIPSLYRVFYRRNENRLAAELVVELHQRQLHEGGVPPVRPDVVLVEEGALPAEEGAAV